MWRYWELLTDKSMPEIAAMKSEDPMQVKMRLGRQIVADFHSVAAADRAQADFQHEVREGAAPSDIETVDFPDHLTIINLPPDALVDEISPMNTGPRKFVNVDKLVALIGLADSITDATRKRKAGAIKIDANAPTSAINRQIVTFGPGVYYVRVGKKWKRVRVS
jgi:tyrosyl-tRNA synthetase